MKKSSALKVLGGLLMAGACLAACGVTPPAKDKFHVYLLIGQSNMAGRGQLTENNRVSTERILKLDADGNWVEAVEPLHYDKKSAGAGLAASFARTMADADPSVTIGLVPCAVGGTSLNRWKPGQALYTNAVARAKRALRDGTFKGILWHQGCADSGLEKSASSYAARVTKMLTAMRKELDAVHVPIVMGELGTYLADHYKKGKNGERKLAAPYWQTVNAQIAEAVKALQPAAVVSSQGLTPNKDILHFNTESLRTFGVRYADEMKKLQK